MKLPPQHQPSMDYNSNCLTHSANLPFHTSFKLSDPYKVMLYWTWNDPSSVHGSSIQQMSLVVEWVRQLKFESIDGWCCEFDSQWRQLYFCWFWNPSMSICTKMPEMSDLCYLGKTRMEVFAICDCDNISNSYAAHLWAKTNSSCKLHSVNGPWFNIQKRTINVVGSGRNLRPAMCACGTHCNTFIGRSTRGAPVTPPPLGPIFAIFMQCLGKIGQNNKWAPPPLWLVHPPLGNPGSVTDFVAALYLWNQSLHNESMSPSLIASLFKVRSPSQHLKLVHT